MSTVHANGIDMKQSGIPMWRLVRAELRKLIDTRAGFWLLAVIGLVVLLVVVILGWTALAYDEPMSWGALLVATNLPMGLLLPIFGVMTVTSEWGQRTGLVTFTLEPRRVRTVIAKLLAGSLATLGAVLLSLAVTALVNVGLGSLSDNTVVWDVSARVVLMFALVHLSGFALGFGFGMVIPNTPTAIVVFFLFRFVVPPLMTWAAAVWGWFEPVLPWINWFGGLGRLERGGMTNEEVAQLLAAMGVWMVAPIVIGAVLLIRREIK